MARFNSTDEVRAYAERVALSDILRAQFQGKDLNPFCTPGARNDWQRGFDGAPPYSWEGNLLWDSIYQRGAAVARLLSSH